MYPQIRIDLYRYVYIPTVRFAARATPAGTAHAAPIGNFGSSTREYTSRGGILYKFILIYVCVFVLICTYIIVYVCGATAARTAYPAPVGDLGSTTLQHTNRGGIRYKFIRIYVCVYALICIYNGIRLWRDCC